MKLARLDNFKKMCYNYNVRGKDLWRKGEKIMKSRQAKEIIIQDKKTGEVMYFASYNQAAIALGVSREAVRTWAEGIYKSRKYEVLS